MPLLKFDIFKGRTPTEISEMLDAAHEAMVDAFNVPYRDRYQSLTQHNPGELIIQDTGLGYERSEKAVLLTVISRPRTQTQKEQFYKKLSSLLESRCGLRPEDLMISMVENSDADWSFGCGKAEFITGELK